MTLCFPHAIVESVFFFFSLRAFIVCVNECDRLLVVYDYEAFLIGEALKRSPFTIFPYRPTLSLYCPDCVQSFGVRRRNKRLSIRV